MGAVIAGDMSGEDYYLAAVGGNGRELTKKRLDFIGRLHSKAKLDSIKKPMIRMIHRPYITPILIILFAFGPAC